jgi:cobalamin biosynthesis protein CbiD
VRWAASGADSTPPVAGAAAAAAAAAAARLRMPEDGGEVVGVLVPVGVAEVVYIKSAAPATNASEYDINI